jgi:hypothetical protein
MTTPSSQFPARLASLLKSVRELHVLRGHAARVDGAIVGTGQADFTISNVPYQFGATGQGFCLMDVPGIEGNESRYAGLVKDALAKAHAVFYVNGTNKKPEAETAAKIAEYLHHDTIVHPILNVRGRADAYELDSDRISLSKAHGDVAQNAALTEEVLRQGQGADVVRPALLVQGMAALSAVALDRGASTLVPERADLLRAQKGMLEVFGDAGHLRTFSQIDQVREVLMGYAGGGGREAILDANRRRIVRLVRAALSQLDSEIEKSAAATAAVSHNINAHTDSILRAVTESETVLQRSASVAIDDAFARLGAVVSNIVSEHFQSREKANSEADRAASTAMDALRAKIQVLAADSGDRLSDDVKEALTRLKADISSLQNASFRAHKDGFVISLGSALEAIDFQLADAGKLLARMSSYALAGAGLGATALVIGSAIGAAIGAVLGALVELGMYLGFGRDKKIREAQTKALAALAKSAEEMKGEVALGIRRQYVDMRKTIDEKVLAPLSQEVSSMTFAGVALGRQRARIAAILEHIEETASESV